MKKFFAVILIMMLVLPGISSSEDKEFVLRNGILFGDDIETIKEKEPENFKIVESTVSVSDSEVYDEFHLFSWTTLAGIDTDIVYYFDREGHLAELVYFMGKGLSDYEYKTLADALTKKYGEPLSRKDYDYHFRGMASDLSGVEKAAENEFIAIPNVLAKDIWTVQTNNEVVVIQLIKYKVTSSLLGTYEQGRLGYSLIPIEEYKTALEEAEKKVREQEEQRLKEEEQKIIDLKDNI